MDGEICKSLIDKCSIEKSKVFRLKTIKIDFRALRQSLYDSHQLVMYKTDFDFYSLSCERTAVLFNKKLQTKRIKYNGHLCMRSAVRNAGCQHAKSKALFISKEEH